MFAAGYQAFCDANTGAPLVPDQNFLPLRATLNSLLPGRQWGTAFNCAQIEYFAEGLYNAEVQKAKVPNGVVTLTITDPNATTTTISVPVDPVVPAFTG
jgi:hypothetical protein